MGVSSWRPAPKDCCIKLWSISHELCLQTLTDSRTEVWSMALRRSDSSLVVAGGDPYLFWYRLSGEELVKVGTTERAVPCQPIVGMAFSADGAELFCQLQGKRNVEVFRRRKGAKKKQNQQSGSEVYSLAHEDLPASLYGGSKTTSVRSIAWHKKGLLVAYNDNSLCMFAAKGEDTEAVHTVDRGGHRRAVRALAFNADATLLASCSAESVRIWNMKSKRVTRVIASGYGQAAMFVGKGQYVLIGTKDGQIQIFDIHNAEVVCNVQAHGEGKSIYGIASVDPSSFYTVSADK